MSKMKVLKFQNFVFPRLSLQLLVSNFLICHMKEVFNLIDGVRPEYCNNMFVFNLFYGVV